MTRVLFVHHTSFIGGGSYCLLNIIKVLDRQYFEPLVLLREEGTLAEELRKLDVNVIFFPQMETVPYNRSLLRRKSLHQYLRVFRSLSPFAKLLESIDADVLYLNNMMIYHYLSVAKKQGMKTVLHVREHWPLDEHKTQLRWAQNAVYKHADKLVAINNYGASMFPQKDATIVYDWIDMDERYKPMPMNDIFGEDMTDKKVFLYTGGIQNIKGAYEVVKTFCKKITNPSYRLLVLGFTKELSGDGLIRIIKSILYRIGFPTYEYKVKMIVRSDKRVVCIPRVYEIKDIIEQSCCMLSYFTIPHANLALAESIILGTPVIAARTQESEEYSLDGELASLFEMNDIDDFEQAIRNFINNETELRAELSHENRQKIADMFSPQQNAKRLNDTLKELVK